MAINAAFFDVWTPRALSVLRFVTAFLFLQHSTAKLLGVPHVAMFDTLPLLSLIGFAGLLELAGSVLLILGLFIRPTAFILSGEMAFAYFIGHAAQGNFFSPMLNQGEPAVLFCFIFLLLSVAGGGTWSIDASRQRKVQLPQSNVGSDVQRGPAAKERLPAKRPVRSQTKSPPKNRRP